MELWKIESYEALEILNYVCQEFVGYFLTDVTRAVKPNDFEVFLKSSGSLVLILSQFSSQPGRKNICYFILLITWKQSLSNSTQTYKLDLTSNPFPAPYVKLFCPFPWPWSTLQLMIKTKRKGKHTSQLEHGK